MLEYEEINTGTCSTVDQNLCETVALQKNVPYRTIHNELNPSGCFIHYFNNPDEMFYNTASGQDCDDKKTCVCTIGKSCREIYIFK